MQFPFALAGVAVLSALSTVTSAQPAPPPPALADFPPHAERLDEETLRERLAGKVVRMQFAAGPNVRLDIRANGYVYGDASNGWRDTGRWRIEGSSWCDEWNRGQVASGCNEVRLADGVLLLKRRSNGEIVELRE